MTETFQDLYTGYEDWHNIDIRELQKAMRRMYNLGLENSPEHLSIKKTGLENVDKYSYKAVGEIIKKALEDAN